MKHTFGVKRKKFAPGGLVRIQIKLTISRIENLTNESYYHKHHAEAHKLKHSVYE